MAAAAILVLPVAPAVGLVLHDDAEPTDRPADEVVGRWATNASCVVVCPSMIVTTRHQGGGVGTLVEIGGLAYQVVEVRNHNTADLRVARIRRADGQIPVMREWAWPYSGSEDIKRPTVIGGYGKGRGETKYTDAGVPYAYLWSGGGNRTLRWGVNYVDLPVYQIQVGLVRSKGLRADFDDVGEGGHLPYEAAPALYDSGSGWFIYEDGAWQVIGLSALVEHSGETWFRNATTGSPDPDSVYAVRVGCYREWIMDTITSWIVPGDTNGDRLVDGGDFTIWSDNLKHAGVPAWSDGGWVLGNFNEDNIVDGCDYTIWAEAYHEQIFGQGIPEPATFGLLAAGALLLLLRRKARSRAARR